MTLSKVSAAAVAASAVALALAGAGQAAAKDKAHRGEKPAAEKMACGGKNGCPGMDKTKADAAAPAAAPAQSGAAGPAKAGEAK